MLYSLGIRVELFTNRYGYSSQRTMSGTQSGKGHQFKWQPKASLLHQMLQCMTWFYIHSMFFWILITNVHTLIYIGVYGVQITWESSACWGCGSCVRKKKIKCQMCNVWHKLCSFYWKEQNLLHWWQNTSSMELSEFYVVCNHIIKLYFSKPTNTILGARWVYVLPDEVHCTVAVEEVAGEVAAVAVVVAAVAVVAAAADTAGGLY